MDRMRLYYMLCNIIQKQISKHEHEYSHTTRGPRATYKKTLSMGVRVRSLTHIFVCTRANINPNMQLQDKLHLADPRNAVTSFLKRGSKVWSDARLRVWPCVAPLWVAEGGL